MIMQIDIIIYKNGLIETEELLNFQRHNSIQIHMNKF